jgi:hypothetical protein
MASRLSKLLYVLQHAFSSLSDGLSQFFVRGLEPEDWARFMFYSHRIKRLDYPWFPRTQSITLDEAWEVLAASRPPSLPVLLPNLRQLTACESGSWFPYIRYLMSHKLSIFKLDWTCSEIPKLSLLSALPAICPDLIHLDVSYPPRDATAVCRSLTKYTSLRKLHVKAIHINALEYIASLHVLEDFSADMSFTAGQHILLEPGSFPELKTLKLDNVHVPSILLLLSAISSGRLTSLTLHATSENDQNCWSKLMGSLKWHTRSIKHLTVVEPTTEDQIYREPKRVDISTLLPLNWMNQLVTLTINSRSIELDNVALGTLSGGWPSLQELDFGSKDSRYRPIRALTLEGLLSLTMNCPQLRVLTTYIDATISPRPLVRKPKQNTWRANRNLTLLNVGFSPLSNTVQVGCYLCELFPELKFISTSQNVPNLSKLWGEVMRHLQVVHTIRSQSILDDDEG